MKRIVSDGAWVTLGQAMSALGALASVRILTEILSPEEFGLFALSIGIVNLLQGMFCSPVLQALLRFFPDFSAQQSVGTLLVTVKGIVMHRAGLLCGCGFLVGLALRSFLPVSIALVVLLTFYLATEMWRAYEINIFNAARKQREFAVLVGLDAWLKSLLALAIGSVGAGIEGVVGGFVLGSLAMVGLALAIGRRARPEGGHSDNSAEQRIKHFGRPLVPLALVGWSVGNVDRYGIGVVLGAGAAGTYSAAYGLVSRPFLMAGQILEQSLRQRYYEAHTQGDRRSACRTFGAWLFSAAFFGIMGFLGVLWFDNLIARLFLGAEFRESVVVMPWVAAAYGLFGITQAAERRFYALYQTKRVLVIEGVGLMVIVALIPFLLPSMGIRGAAVALLAGAAAQLVCTLYALAVVR